MGGRGGSSARGGGNARGGSSEIAARLGFTFAEENGAAALPEATKLLVAEAIQEMVDEFPSLRGSVDRIDLHKRSDPNELAGVRFNFNNHAVLALGPDFQDLAKANRDVRNGIHNGFYVKNTDLKGVIHHELGHILERQVFLKRYTHLKNAERQFQQGKIANRIVNNASRDKTVDSDYGNFVKSNGYLKDYRTTISGYAAHSGHETIAEAVADYKRNGSNAAPLSQAIWKELKRSLNG